MTKLGRASLAIGLLVALATASAGVSAQQAQSLREEVNTGTVRVITGDIDGTAFRAAADMAAVLNQKGDLRILPVIGRGPIQNVTDILYLEGIDVAIVQLDVLDYMKREKVFRGLDRRIQYITKLYNEELHVLVGEGISSIEDLAGKKVNFGLPGSGANITAANVFEILGVSPEPVSDDIAMALEKLKRGEIAGMVYVSGKPARLFQSIKPEDGLHFLPIPFQPELLQTYMPAKLSNEDYPNLVAADGDVGTIAVSSAMVAFNWKPDTERYQNLSNFVETFFDKLPEFSEQPRHKKWTEVSVTSQIPGWTRFGAAEDWLRRNGPTGKMFTETEIRGAFRRFLEQEATVTEEQTDLLLQRFLELLEGRPS